jgi:hypothetical protein
MSKLIAWMKDTGAWFLIIPIVGILFLYGSVVFSLENFYSRSVHAAPVGWHFAGWILTVATIIWFAKADDPTTGKIIFGGFVLVLAICAFAGFNFQFA